MDLVVFAFLIPPQAVPYLAILAALRGLRPGRRDGARTPRTVVICHNVLPHESRPADEQLTRLLLRRAGAALTHSAAEAARARALAPEAPLAVARMPPHLPAAAPAAHLNGHAGHHAAERAVVGGVPPAGCSSSGSSARTRASTCCWGLWRGRPGTSF